MHAAALELLSSHIARPGSRVLDVGCGSGVLVACIARMQTQAPPGHGGLVVGIDVVPALVEASKGNLRRDGITLTGETKEVEQHEADRKDMVQPARTLEQATGSWKTTDVLGAAAGGSSQPVVIVKAGNGWHGAEALGPFDAIHCGAAAPHVPAALRRQLAGGLQCRGT